MKVSENWKLIGISMLLLVGLVACNKQESTTTKLLSATTAGNKIPMVVDPNQLADLRKSTLKEGMPVYNGDGFALNAETWILCTANQFGEIDNCHIDIRGRNATTGKQYDIRKWDLSRFKTCGEDKAYLWLTNFFGPRKPMRLFFDGDSKFVEIVGNGDRDDFFVPLEGDLRERLEGAKSVKVFHGIAADEISYVYDMSAYRNAVALTEAICNKAQPSGVISKTPEEIATDEKAKAVIKLAETYWKGEGVPKDYAKALELLSPLAIQGNANAQNRLATLYFGGPGVTQDYAKAFEWIEKAVAQGNADAQLTVGNMYYLGQGVTQDYANAFKWIEKSALQGNAEAQSDLGFMYEVGQGVTQDYAKALEWIEKSAAQGDAEAQLTLGSMYYKGEGVTQDYAKASEWYQKPAAQGNAEAQLTLGSMYYKGQGVTQDYAKAFEWIEKSALQGNANAQANLGYMYENGQGTAKDNAKALELYQKSAAQGNTDAQKLIDRMNKKLNRKNKKG